MSCLFNSLSYFIKKDSNYIRQKICDYLEQNNNIIEGLDTKFILSLDNKNYIKRMRMNETWGGAIEIQAACNIWNLRIIIHNIRDNKKNKMIEFVPVNNDYTYTIHLSWSGNHYEQI
jgi:hypothetical protein